MSVQLNHTIINVRDKRVSAPFYTSTTVCRSTSSMTTAPTRSTASTTRSWADPAKQIPNQHNTHFGGRGVYWEDPDGHFLEIITQPYGQMEEIG